jgi:hypothetical protein
MLSQNHRSCAVSLVSVDCYTKRQIVAGLASREWHEQFTCNYLLPGKYRSIEQRRSEGGCLVSAPRQETSCSSMKLYKS